MPDSSLQLSKGVTPEFRRDIEAWFRKRGLPRFVINYGVVASLRGRPSAFLPSPAACLPSVTIAAAIGMRMLLALGTVTVVTKALVVVVAFVSSRRRPAFPMLGWVWGELRRQLSRVLNLLIRALPLLLIFVTFLFMQNEVWQLTEGLHGPALRVTLTVFPVVTMLFAAIQLYGDSQELCSFKKGWSGLAKELGWDGQAGDEARRAADDLTAGLKQQLASFADQLEKLGIKLPDVQRRQRLNAALVMLFVLTLQILAVSVAVGLFFLLFGMLAVTPDITHDWAGLATGQDPRVLVEWTWLNQPLVLTEELLKVTALITAFSGLYFTFSVLAEEERRRRFLQQLDSSIREAFAVRAVYVNVCWAPAVKRGHDHCEVTFDLPAHERERAELLLLEEAEYVPHEMYRHRNNRFACTLKLEPKRVYRYRYRLDDTPYVIDGEGVYRKVKGMEYSELAL